MSRGPFTGASRYRRERIDGKLHSIHRYRAEQALGKPLPPGAQVHHADGTTNETAPLVICQDATYHQLLHVRTRVYRAGGDPNTQRICARCKLLRKIGAFSKDNTRPGGLQRICVFCEARRTVVRAEARRRARGAA